MEIIFSIIILNEYLFSFFFWLNLFSIVSLLTEIESITEKIVYLLIEEAPQEKEDSTLTPKINTIVRLIKIIRLIRIVKIYKAVLDFIKNYEIKKKLEEIHIRDMEKIKMKEINITLRKKAFASILTARIIVWYQAAQQCLTPHSPS